MKICYRCKKDKELREFHKDLSKKDGLQSLCIECKAIYDQKRRSTQLEKEKTKINNTLFKSNNPDYFHKWSISHRKHLRDKKKNRREIEADFRIKDNLTSRLNRALRGNYKSGSAVGDLGCSIDELKQWFEQQFEPGMTWENYGRGEGKWNIDHIIPLRGKEVDLTDRNELKKICHWFNLRPMWHNENLSKGNRI